MARARFGLKWLLLFTVAAGSVIGFLSPPLVAAYQEVGWFGAPLHALGLEKFSILAIAAFFASVPAAVWLLVVSCKEGPKAIGNIVFLLALAFACAAFILSRSVSATRTLVVFLFVVLIPSVTWTTAAAEHFRASSGLAAVLVWVAFWLVTSSIILTL